MKAFHSIALTLLASVFSQAAIAQQTFYYNSSSPTTNCQVTRERLAPNGVGVSSVVMLIDGAGPCHFKFRFDGQFAPDSWELVEAPKSGKITFNGDTVEYLPNTGFIGDDKFVVAVFGRGNWCNFCLRNGRYAVVVTVKPKP
jgi:hypothetical protein